MAVASLSEAETGGAATCSSKERTCLLERYTVVDSTCQVRLLDDDEVEARKYRRLTEPVRVAMLSVRIAAVKPPAGLLVAPYPHGRRLL